jgi:hypothetical protein
MKGEKNPQLSPPPLHPPPFASRGLFSKDHKSQKREEGGMCDYSLLIDWEKLGIFCPFIAFLAFIYYQVLGYCSGSVRTWSIFDCSIRIHYYLL